MVYKIVPLHSMKAFGGGRSIATLIRNIGTIWRWVVDK